MFLKVFHAQVCIYFFEKYSKNSNTVNIIII